MPVSVLTDNYRILRRMAFHFVLPKRKVRATKAYHEVKKLKTKIKAQTIQSSSGGTVIRRASHTQSGRHICTKAGRHNLQSSPTSRDDSATEENQRRPTRCETISESAAQLQSH